MTPDRGEADPVLAAALLRGTGTPQQLAALHAALVGARVLIPLVAFAGSTPMDTTATEFTARGLRDEPPAEIALMTLVVDGRSALPVFSSLAELLSWRADARPVPMSGSDACRSAVERGAVALVIDPAGAAVTITPLAELARGWVPVAGASLAVRRTTAELVAPDVAPDPGLVDALVQALRGEPVLAARLFKGPDGPVLGVVPSAAPDPVSLAALASRVASRLGAALPADGLDLAAVDLDVLGQDGPGLVLPLGRPLGWRWPRRRR